MYGSAKHTKQRDLQPIFFISTANESRDFCKNINDGGFSGTKTSFASGLHGSAEIKQGASSSIVPPYLGGEGGSEVRK